MKHKHACRPGLALPVTLCSAGLLLLDAINPDTAAACAVCFGAAQSEAVRGLQAGILLLLGMVVAGVRRCGRVPARRAAAHPASGGSGGTVAR